MGLRMGLEAQDEAGLLPPPQAIPPLLRGAGRWLKAGEVTAPLLQRVPRLSLADRVSLGVSSGDKGAQIQPIPLGDWGSFCPSTLSCWHQGCRVCSICFFLCVCVQGFCLWLCFAIYSRVVFVGSFFSSFVFLPVPVPSPRQDCCY